MPPLFTRHSRLIGLVVLAALLGGCQSEVEQACPDVDWFKLGYEDGRVGDRGLRIENTRKSCSQVQAWNKPKPERGLYFAGWKKGIAEYCSPASGLELGKQGVAFKQICPAELATAFESAYRDGRRQFDSRGQREARKAVLRQQAARLDAEYADLRGQLPRTDSRDEYNRIRDRLKEVSRKLRETNEELKSLEAGK